MNTSFKDFGDWLRSWREASKLSQQELADRIGKTKSYISNIERQQPHAVSGAIPSPKIEVVDAIAKALDRPIEEARLWAGYGIKEEDRPSGVRMPKLPGRFYGGGLPSDNKADSTKSEEGLESAMLYFFRRIELTKQYEVLADLIEIYRQQITPPGLVPTIQETQSTDEPERREPIAPESARIASKHQRNFEVLPGEAMNSEPKPPIPDLIALPIFPRDQLTDEMKRDLEIFEEQDRELERKRKERA